MSALTAQVSQLLAQARHVLGDGPGEPGQILEQTQQRLDEPLRVAIAGKVKAGKSTLLNALVGQRLAPTDAGECTKIVTWYRDGSTYRVTMHPASGEPRQLRFQRQDHALEIDLSGTAVSLIDRIEVEWPSSTLSKLSLVDTPGIDSINTDISARTEDFLTPDDRPSSTDAVLYLMRHLHENDVRFLESFHDQVASQPSAVNSIGVLSRADEIGVGRLDAMGSARRIAERYSADPKVRRLCQVVLPVAGLLAESATTLRQDEFRILQILASSDRAELDSLLVSVDRFADADTDLAITSTERHEILDRFGLFGVRLSCALIRQERASTSSELAEQLVERSGLASLRRTLHSHFSARGDVLRARSALLTLEAVLAEHGSSATAMLDADLERLVAGTHEFAEVHLMSALRASVVVLAGTDLERAERLLGASGTLAHERLDAPSDTSAGELATLATDQHGYWQSLAENPLMARATADAARVLTRTCEGLIAAAHSVR